MTEAVQLAGRNRRWQLNMPVALAISVILHVILLLASYLLPERQVATHAAVQEAPLRFQFADEAPADTDRNPEGQVPFDSPRTEPSSLPTPPPQGMPELVPESAPTPPANPQVEPAPELLPEPEANRSSEPAEAPDNSEPLDEREGLSDMPEGEVDPFASAREAVPASPRESDELNRRLSDFGRAVERARAARPAPSGGAPKSVFSPTDASLPTTGFGVGNMVFESRDYDWSDYYRQIYVQLWRAWHNRLYRTTDEFERWGRNNGVVSLNDQSQARFVIERGGTVVGIQLEGSSGCTPLDASAIDALAEVIFPPLPADFPRDQEVVHVRFIATGNILEMRRQLTYYKSLGLF